MFKPVDHRQYDVKSWISVLVLLFCSLSISFVNNNDVIFVPSCPV